MKIQILGAAGGEVTGSAYYVQTQRASVLVDCGLFQGGKKAEALNRPPTTPKQKLDAVLLTHGHLDHTGRLPLLAKRGHTMPVFATPATIEMASLIMRDSARLQVSDNERKNRKRMRAGEPPQEPLYTPEDAEKIIQLLQPVPYQKPFQVAPGLQAIWTESGHMLGSTSIQLIVEEDGRTKRVIFSGDLGPKGALILKDFEPFKQADLVFLESTYGDHDHRPFKETVDEFVRIVKDTVEKRGKILVPTFAVGRAQQMLVLMHDLVQRGRVRPFPIYLDSPMAIQATRIYSSHPEGHAPSLSGIGGRDLFVDKWVSLYRTRAESESLNARRGPAVIISSSGMLSGGRVLHHCRVRLPHAENTLLITGYQAEGTLGRRLLDGAHTVRIHKGDVEVRAEVTDLKGLSGHADARELVHWLSAVKTPPRRVFITHGEELAAIALGALLEKERGFPTHVPSPDEVVELV